MMPVLYTMRANPVMKIEKALDGLYFIPTKITSIGPI